MIKHGSDFGGERLPEKTWGKACEPAGHVELPTCSAVWPLSLAVIACLGSDSSCFANVDAADPVNPGSTGASAT